MSVHLDLIVDKYLAAKEVAARVGYTSDYVTRLAREGKVSAERRGRQWFVDPDSVKLFLLQMEERKRSLQDKIRDERLNERAKFYTQIAEEEMEVAIHSTHQVAFFQTTIVSLCLFVFANLVWFSFEQDLRVDHIAFGATTVVASLSEQVLSPIPEVLSQVASFAFIVGGPEFGSGGMSEYVAPSDVDAVDSENVDFQGVILLEDELMSADELQELRASFSDEVRVDFDDNHTGVITPVFKERDGDSYRFLLVPVSHSENE